jgi:membrane dipeptidase
MDALRAAGVILDVTHAAEVAFWQLMEHWDGPLHASHCNCRALVPGQRHLSDEMIQAICERGGVVGSLFVEQMLNPRWDFDDPSTHGPTASRPMRAVVEHIDHICQLTGSSDHVALGSDLDGGFGRELAPVDLDTIADLQLFLGVLREKGYSDEDVAKIAHGNLLRLFRDAWREA